MKLKFEPNRQYQLDAINAVVDIFAGQPKDSEGAARYIDQDGQLSLEATITRSLVLDAAQTAENMRTVQQRNGILPDENNLIDEPNQCYGWKKFIIVVPSIAIREEVLKNLEITREHFADLYNKPEMNYYVWDSKKTGQAREFATNDTLQIMVITIDSFAKAQNVMNRQSTNGRPLDFIKATRPVVILDEPQNMETDTRRNALLAFTRCARCVIVPPTSTYVICLID